MKRISSIILCFCLYVSASAQVDSVLFGLSRAPGTSTIGAGGTVYLAKVNAGSGLVSNVSSSSIGTGIQMFSAAIDSYNKIYYYVNSANQLVGLSLLTGNIVSSAPVTNSNGTYISEIIFNCSDTTIYGLARGIATPTNPSSGYVYLAKINPATGVVTNISASSVATGIQLMNVTIDPYNKIYYFVNQSGNMVGLSLTSGAVVSNNALTNSNAQYFSQMTYNRSDSTIYGLARGTTNPNNPSSGYIYLAKVNPATGVVTNISASSLASGMNVSIGTIDPYSKVFYFLGSNGNFIGASLLTGASVSNPALTFSNAQYLDQVVFNCRFCPGAKPSGATNVKEIVAENLFKLYPNPSSSGFSVEFGKGGNYKIEIINLSGQVVLSENILNAKGAFLKTASFKKGVYYCKITGIDNATIATQKIVLD